ncbi:MAG: hypothetical protein GX962_16565 [Epulopiscium sp.]|nr:hypothetical protein [Candidatus Epulonipiscium sp.]
MIVRKFKDGSVLEYGKGKFDDWCVYLTRPGILRHAPLDKDYFSRLRELGEIHNSKSIYDDFVDFYKDTNKKIDSNILDKIETLSQKYDNDALEVAVLFTILYMGMVAEENKKHTKLGKRIKRLGMHQVLIEGMEPTVAANYSRGMRWREIDGECNNRGF